MFDFTGLLSELTTIVLDFISGALTSLLTGLLEGVFGVDGEDDPILA